MSSLRLTKRENKRKAARQFWAFSAERLRSTRDFGTGGATCSTAHDNPVELIVLKDEYAGKVGVIALRRNPLETIGRPYYQDKQSVEMERVITRYY